MIKYYATLENGKTVYIDLETSKLYLHLKGGDK